MSKADSGGAEKRGFGGQNLAQLLARQDLKPFQYGNRKQSSNTQPETDSRTNAESGTGAFSQSS